MNIHNMMEDLVIREVNALYDQVKKSGTNWLSCDCQNCRLDTISYVLNRIPPKYVVSGRGVTHSASDIFENHQLIADVTALAMDGIRIINSTTRPFHALPREECVVQKEEEPSFNFPTFTGTLLDGSTFEPISGAKITLKLDGKPAEMVDMTWQNPVQTFQSTKGSFGFWVRTQHAKEPNMSKRFEFELDVEAEGYEKSYHYFEVPLVSEEKANTELNTACSIKINDIVLFKLESAGSKSQEKAEEPVNKKASKTAKAGKTAKNTKPAKKQKSQKSK